MRLFSLTFFPIATAASRLHLAILCRILKVIFLKSNEVLNVDEFCESAFLFS